MTYRENNCRLMRKNQFQDTTLKIIHVYKDYYPILGGIENHIKTLAEAQVAAGHEVSILVTNPARLPDKETMNGVQIIRTRRLATVASTPLTIDMPFKLARQRVDITHLHFPYPIGELSQWLMGRGRPYVITYHSDVVRQQNILRFYRPLLTRVLAKAARILPTSDNYVASSPYLQPLAHKCTAVPLSVDIEPFQKATPLIPKTEHPTLLFVGRHRYYKGVDNLIQAMPQLQEARLLIGGDGPLRDDWQALSHQLGLSDRIQFVGSVSDDDLPRLFASADIFVLPANARAEAFGKVLLEAMATGLPCITTELGTGTSFVVQDGLSGLVVPPRQPQKLAEAIQKLLDDPSLRTKLGAAGLARAQQMFTVDKMVTRVEAIYNEITNKF